MNTPPPPLLTAFLSVLIHGYCPLAEAEAILDQAQAMANGDAPWPTEYSVLAGQALAMRLCGEEDGDGDEPETGA
jgi:hypothetical protein